MSELVETKIHFFDIPPEIREIIYSYFKLIRDTKTQLSIRNVCSEWRYLINDILVYDKNNKIQYIHKFQKDRFKTLYSNGSLKKKMLFEPYSKFKYVEYNENRKLIKIMENFPPYEIVMHEKRGSRIYTKKTNLLTCENSIEISQKYECMNALNPIINDEDNVLNNNHPNFFINPNNAPMCFIS